MTLTMLDHHQPCITPEKMEAARSYVSANKLSLTEALGVVTQLEPTLLAQEIASILGFQYFKLEDMKALQPQFQLISLAKTIQKQCLILRNIDGVLFGVMHDAFDVGLQTWIRSQAKQAVQFSLVTSETMSHYLLTCQDNARTTDGLSMEKGQEKRESKSATVLTFSSITETTSTAVKLVNATLYDALKVGASDIHLESTSQGLVVKYRIDGVLDFITSTNNIEDAERVISRLKVLAELDIAETRIPQDGSFCVEAYGREIDLRLSIMPSIHGEDAVIRILDKRAMIEAYGALNLDTLGFDSSSLATLRRLTEDAYGMLLVTGPTGSGKTTTLYAALTEINNGREKIITIEDPVEYQLPGILQIPVNEKKGLTFARGLRSILRHDPDKIMVGEIRDKETAEIAVQSALTGHLVLTTVHANNVFDVFGRFTHMGIDPYAFVSALNGIWAQRLVRLNCQHCLTPVEVGDKDLARASLTRTDVSQYQFMKGKGCSECRETGYKGRRAIAEILTLNDEIRELIIEKRPIRQIKEAARLNGTTSLRDAALKLVQNGETTLEEILRITLHA